MTTFIDKEIVDTNKDIKGIDESIKKYKDLAVKDSEEVQKAKDASAESFNSISGAHDELVKALHDVEELMTAINDLGEIDIKKLEEAEKAMEAADAKISGKMTTDFMILQTKVAEQEIQIAAYKDNLSELTRQLNNTEQLYKGIPRTCFRILPTPEPSYDSMFEAAIPWD